MGLEYFPTFSRCVPVRTEEIEIVTGMFTLRIVTNGNFQIYFKKSLKFRLSAERLRARGRRTQSALVLGKVHLLLFILILDKEGRKIRGFQVSK